MLFFAKIIISAVLIAFASWLAGRNPRLAGFIIALPLASVLAIIFSYWQYRDMQKLNEFAVSILAAVPLSLFFFVPFILNRWLKFSFGTTFSLALFCVLIAYLIHSSIFKPGLFQ